MLPAASRLVIREAVLPGPDAAAVGAAVRAYLAGTEEEKIRHGVSTWCPQDGALPESYRREVADPRGVYGRHRVYVADLAGEVVGVVVLVVSTVSEVKRLWAAPPVRGRGVGSALLDQVLAVTPGRVRLSVRDWRTEALRLYRSRGFVAVPSWDGCERLVGRERSSRPAADAAAATNAR